MRRTDREVTDRLKIQAIMDACDCCRLGLNDGGMTYIVPMSFGWEECSGGYVLYFHCAPEGRKLDILRKDPAVSFEMDTGYRLNPSQTACGYSCAFQSVMGTGMVSFMETAEEKRQGLQRLMEHMTGQRDWNIPDGGCQGVCVFRLEVQSISCKEHL
jgi:hypothetical protein